MVECKESILTSNRKFLWLLTFYQIGPNGLFIFYQVFNLILQSAVKKGWYKRNYKNFELIVHIKLLKHNKKEKFNIAPSYVEKYIIQYFNEHNLSKEKYREIIKILY